MKSKLLLITSLVLSLCNNESFSQTQSYSIDYLFIQQWEDKREQEVAKLIKKLKSPSKKVRYNAVNKLGIIGLDAAKAVPALIELSKSRDKSDRFRAAVALGKMGPVAKKSLPRLRRIKLSYLFDFFNADQSFISGITGSG